MSEPSLWPLSETALRVRVPKHIVDKLQASKLTSDIYLSAAGFYPRAEHHRMGRVGHDDYILLYCTEGLGHINTQNYQGAVRKGELIILPPGSRHRYHADTDKPWTIFWCHFSGTHARDYYQHIYKRTKHQIIDANDLRLQHGFRDLVELSRTSFSESAFTQASCLLKFLLASIERQANTEHKGGAGIDLEGVQYFMRQNIDRKVSLDELAAFCRMSKYHFSRQYHALTGIAPLQHFSHLKIEQACHMLEHGEISISEVAYKLGYDDPLYFSRVFKKLTKLSPSEYRKNLIAQS